MRVEEPPELLSPEATRSVVPVGQEMFTDQSALRDKEAGPCYTESVYHRYPRFCLVFCLLVQMGRPGLSTERQSIENRPSELERLPYYRDLPRLPVTVDLSSSTGGFLAKDVLSLVGVQPLEIRHSVANAGILDVNPSQDSISIYRDERVKFQLVHIVVNCYQFKEANGKLVGRPYNISLQPSSKRGELSFTTVDWVENIDLLGLLDAQQMYKGFNPFTGAYGFYMIGDVDYSDIESDMLGFVHGFYVLVIPFKHDELLAPDLAGLRDHPQARKDYHKFRKSRYFKPFMKLRPRRVWGCDSPIELFLLQALGSLGLEPELQTMLCEDGFTAPNLHTLWENQKSRRRMKLITEADFFFPEQRFAVFCDSKAHHSSPKAQQKDAEIDRKLLDIGVRSLRVLGVDIAKSPLECAQRVRSAVEEQA